MKCTVLNRQGRRIDVAFKNKVRMKLPQIGDLISGFVVDTTHNLIRIGRGMTGRIADKSAKFKLGEYVKNLWVDRVENKNKITLSFHNKKRKRGDQDSNTKRKKISCSIWR